MGVLQTLPHTRNDAGGNAGSKSNGSGPRYQQLHTLKKVASGDYTVSLRAALFVVLVSILMTAVSVTVVMEHLSSHRTDASCDVPEDAPKPRAPEVADLEPSRAERLFAELSAQEVQEVTRFAASWLGCASRYAGPCAPPSVRELGHQCYFSGAEAVVLHVPQKAAATRYLDGTDSTRPNRLAEVTAVYPGKPADEGVAVFIVGPLDGTGGVSPNATVALKHNFHYGRRPVDPGEVLCPSVSHGVLTPLKDILTDSFGPVFPVLDNFKPEEFGRVFADLGPAASSSLERRVSRVTWHWYPNNMRFEINYAHPLPFTYYTVQAGPPETWYAENVTYCDQIFPRVDDMLQADKDGTLKRCHTKLSSNFTWDIVWNKPPRLGVPGSHQGKQPSVQTSPGGSIKWEDWELFMTLRPSSGLALYDVRWRGERILYELALSEAQAHYAARTSDHQWYYSDKAFSMTGLGTNMVAGIDCPADAVYLEGASWMTHAPEDASAFISDTAMARPVCLGCIFEVTAEDSMLWRHGELAGRVDGRLKRMLVMRSVSAVSNYDYISEVRLLEDGSVTVKNEFAGYPENELAAPFIDPSSTEFHTHDEAEGLDWGNRVRGDLVAPMHAHFTVWKVDLDILGVKNEVRLMRSAVDSSSTMSRKVQVEEVLDQEDPDQKIIASAATPGLWRVVNPSKPNALTGESRGYAVVIQKAAALQTLPPEHPFSIASAFAKRHLTVTKHKDEEPSAVHVMDHYPIASPLLSVDNFLADREPLRNEDLVCWVALGKEHITRSEDIPVVSNFAVEFALLPWSYHLQNPGMGLET